MTPTPGMEHPSGKTAATENFPVGSWLLAARLRPHVMAFYAYARAIDDIADSPELEAEEKIRRLEAFAAAIQGDQPTDPALQKAHAARRSLAVTGITNRHCLDLVSAFKQDATKLRYANWDDLMGYCSLSAAPVGRYLLDLHGESESAYPASDALCNALQIINHLQDCKDDYQSLDRVYLPQQWMTAAGTDERALAGGHATRALRAVIDRCLDGTEALLATAGRLPALLSSFRLGMESSVIIAIAKRLCAELRNRDPLAERVTLTRVQFVACGVRGTGRAAVVRALRPFPGRGSAPGVAPAPSGRSPS